MTIPRLSETEHAIYRVLKAAPPEGFTKSDILARVDTTAGSLKVLICNMRKKGIDIVSPRHASAKGPRKHIRQFYRLGTHD